MISSIKYCTFFLFLLFFTAQLSFAQVNLVPNPSFEDTLPHGGYCYGSIITATHWFNPNAASPDLFSYSPGSVNCIASSLNNPAGYQLPRTGFAYGGIYTWAGFTREYAAVKLDSMLSNGCSYYIEFYVSRADTFGLATDKMGCAFVNDTIGFYLNNGGYLPFTTAIQSPPGFLIADDTNWVKISGVYIAQGNEQYLVIGNFYDDANTYVDTVEIAPYYNAYYYIDDVKVLSCGTTGLENFKIKEELFSIYPNPSNGVIWIDNYIIKQIILIEVIDATGRIVLKEERKGTSNLNQINLNKLNNGFYFIKVKFDDMITTKKILIIK